MSNYASATEVSEAASRIAFSVPASHEQEYLELLRKTDEQCIRILSVPGEIPGLSGSGTNLTTDYKPAPDLKRFPRENVHLPLASNNPLKGWAWRGEAGDIDHDGVNRLRGKTVVLKDTICMAQVPLLFGTDAFEGYIREKILG